MESVVCLENISVERSTSKERVGDGNTIRTEFKDSCLGIKPIVLGVGIFSDALKYATSMASSSFVKSIVEVLETLPIPLDTLSTTLV